MYFSQQSPGIAHKLPTHHDQSPWARTHAHHGVLGPPGPPTASQGYAVYTNGAVGVGMQPHHAAHLPHTLPGHPNMHQHHHHTGSISYHPGSPNGHAHTHVAHQQHIMGPGSPASVGSQIISPHWQQQLLKCEMIRSSRSPHHRARASAMASRTVTKSAIPITNPNLIKPSPELLNGIAKEDGDAASNNGTNSEASPSPSAATAANHPSAMAGPVEAPRPTASEPPESTWSSLDMGGVNLKNLPPTSGLFSFTFLINLYLNHNALSSVPAEIAKLRHLEVLDLSGNNLAVVPVELGMLTNLKELYLFDNHIVTLPAELGSLHQLQTLGVEGNPLDASLKAIVQKDGTRALVSYLRDSCPIPSPPPERIWQQLISQAERDAFDADPTVESFTVLCYNILCEKAATARLYGYTPSWALSWDYRKELILNEVMNYNADFLCLQEVDIAQFEDYFSKHLRNHDYEGVYYPKSRYKTMSDADRRLVDGCATFYKKSKYTLVEKHLIEFSTIAMQRQDFKKTDDMFNRVLGKDHIAVVSLMESKETGTRFIIANAHIHWAPQYRDVKLVQVGLLVDEVEKIANDFSRYPPRPPPTPGPDGLPPPNIRPPPIYNDGSKIPLIVAGDFNSVPVSGVYEYLANGSVPPDHEDFMSHMYGKYTSEGMRHRLGLKSAYASIPDLPMTNYTPSFQGHIDYIWYSSANLAVNAVLGEIDKKYLEKVVGFPNAHFPSDHVCIVSEFRVKPPRDVQPRAVTFPGSMSSSSPTTNGVQHS